MTVGYTAYVLDKKSREELLKLFKPEYADVIAHHITHQYGTTESNTPKQPARVTVTGVHDSGAMQILVVEVDGCKYQTPRQDIPEAKNHYHITWSLDRSKGVTPRNANDVLEKICREKGEKALNNLDKPVVIHVTPQFLTDKPAQNPPLQRTAKRHGSSLHGTTPQKKQ